MRKCGLLLLLWGIAWPAMAAKTISIDQMEQLLFKLRGKPDGKVAGELDEIQLTERVSLARLTRWETDLPGSRTRETLMKLVDETAFLSPPESDVLRDPPPDSETQQRMLWMAVQYVRTTISRLPDFYATRETTHFEDTLPQHAINSMAPEAMGTRLGGIPMGTEGVSAPAEFKALHIAGETSRTVTFRDGHEVVDEDTGKQKKEGEEQLWLTTRGEFGPILGMVIGDAMQSQVTWLRWEQRASEPVAEFRYTVAKSQANYRVGIVNGGRVEDLYPAYHGEIEIDPATGEILRLTAVADLEPPYNGMQTALMVEYAPVTIGGRSYVCPVRGVAFSELPMTSATARGGISDVPAVTVQTQLNDVAFTQYHLFSVEAHIVSNGSGPSGATPPAPDTAAEPSESQPVSHP